MTRAVVGTPACWYGKVPGGAAPYSVVCACGWVRHGSRSQREAKRWWARHVAGVRNMAKAAA